MKITNLNSCLLSCQKDYELFADGKMDNKSITDLQVKVHSLLEAIQSGPIEIDSKDLRIDTISNQLQFIAELVDAHVRKKFGKEEVQKNEPILYRQEFVPIDAVASKVPAEKAEEILPIKQCKETLEKDKKRYERQKLISQIVLGLGTFGVLIGLASFPMLVLSGPFFPLVVFPVWIGFIAVSITSGILVNRSEVHLGGRLNASGVKVSLGIRDKKKNLEDPNFLSFAKNAGCTTQKSLLQDDLHLHFLLLQQKAEIEKEMNEKTGAKGSYELTRLQQKHQEILEMLVNQEKVA